MKHLANKLAIILSLSVLMQPALALELDFSVDDEIRKNYDPSKLENDVLTPLPKILTEPQTPVKSDISGSTIKANSAQTPTKTSPIQRTTNSQIVSQPIPQEPRITQTQKAVKTATAPISGNFATLKKGTKFRVVSKTNVADNCKIGARFTLVNLRPVTTTYFTIPAGAEFKGAIIDAHTPQLTGNGGLIVMRIDSVITGGQTYNIRGKITKANYKKVFFNNIKGKRTYLKSTVASTKFGRNYMKKMWRTTCHLAGDGGTVILTPFPVLIGAATLGGNILISPIMGATKRGGRIAIPAGAAYEIKLTEDSVIYQ